MVFFTGSVSAVEKPYAPESMPKKCLQASTQARRMDENTGYSHVSCQTVHAAMATGSDY
jgi:hypothetical protein